MIKASRAEISKAVNAAVQEVLDIYEVANEVDRVVTSRIPPEMGSGQFSSVIYFTEEKAACS